MPTADLSAIAAELKACGVTHVVWVPDSELGAIEGHLDPSLQLVRACREGEAIAIAGGLMLGGAKPVVICQCTGFFEAGDAFRNVVKDLRLPLFVLIGHRNRTAYTAGRSRDTAAKYLERVLHAWELDHAVLEVDGDPGVVGRQYARVQETGEAGAIVVAE